MTSTWKIPTLVSDLFFNHSHQHHDAYEAHTLDDDLCDDGRHEAILLDATEFIEMLGDMAPTKLEPDDLASDFMARL